MKRWRVLIADVDSLRCTRWLNEFAKQPLIQSVRCVEGLEDLRALEGEFPFDVVLASAEAYRPEELIGMMGWMRRTHPGVKVVIDGVPRENGVGLRLLEGGAWAYIPERATSLEVVRCLEAAARGEAVLAPQTAGALIRRLRELSLAHADRLPGPSALQELTPREREILALMARRMSNSEIAQELVVEVGTVKNHVHSVLKKLGVDNRYEAAAFGVQAGAFAETVSAS
ncbi:MAG TPA: response regulator transcription factor [Anaerolineales bacterium]|nr:response regulator transcription factor [Anaerolineales bacterium]